MVVHLRLRMIPHVNWHIQINQTLIHYRDSENDAVGACIERFLPENGHDELIAANYRRSMGRPEDDELVGCAVCLCQIEEGEEIWELACDHIFHRECLDTWLRYGRISCPLCREPVPWIMARNLGCREEAEIEELLSPYSSFLGHNF